MKIGEPTIKTDPRDGSAVVMYEYACAKCRSVWSQENRFNPERCVYCGEWNYYDES